MIVACSSTERSITLDQAKVECELIYNLSDKKLPFNKDILPVLEKRCIACHDAPYQLKLTSAEGVLRGFNKEKVYDGVRIARS